MTRITPEEVAQQAFRMIDLAQKLSGTPAKQESEP
jgi:hypothetical protein